MRTLRFPVSGLVFIMGFLTHISCHREMVSDADEGEKMRACRDITEKAEKETLPLVQPPVLASVEFEGGGFTELPVPADSQLVLGVNLAAFHKAGLLDQAAKLVPPWFMAQNALTFLGLSPGKSVQALVVGLSMDATSWVPARAVAAFTGNFSSTETLERVYNIAGKLPNADLPPFSREGKELVVSHEGRNLRVSPHSEKVILVSNLKNPDTRLSTNLEFTRMTAPIPRNTAIWFAGMKVSRQLPEMPRVVSQIVTQLEQFSGYFNIDAQQNAELQIRLRFSSAESARQAKELIRLGMSQGLMELGPRIQKSFSLDGSTDHESVVSRGRFIRILFRLDRFQTQFLISWMVSSLKETGHWIFERDSGMNASTGPVVLP